MIVEVSRLPKKKVLNLYFPTVKRRTGKESIQFLGLATGYHEIEFRTKTKFLRCEVHHWLSCYGYAWEISKIIEEGKLNGKTTDRRCT